MVDKIKLKLKPHAIIKDEIPKGYLTIAIMENVSLGAKNGLEHETEKELQKTLTLASAKASALTLENLLILASITNGIDIRGPKIETQINNKEAHIIEEGEDTILAITIDKEKSAKFCQEIAKRLVSNKITDKERNEILNALGNAENDTPLGKVRDEVKTILETEHNDTCKDVVAYQDQLTTKFIQLPQKENSKIIIRPGMEDATNPSIFCDPNKARLLKQARIGIRDVYNTLTSHNTKSTAQNLTIGELVELKRSAANKFREHLPDFNKVPDSTMSKFLERLSNRLRQSGAVSAFFGAILTAGLEIHSYIKTGDLDYTKTTTQELASKHFSSALDEQYKGKFSENISQNKMGNQ